MRSDGFASRRTWLMTVRVSCYLLRARDLAAVVRARRAGQYGQNGALSRSAP
jgi:hypothetical protein